MHALVGRRPRTPTLSNPSASRPRPIPFSTASSAVPCCPPFPVFPTPRRHLAAAACTPSWLPTPPSRLKDLASRKESPSHRGNGGNTSGGASYHRRSPAFVCRLLPTSPLRMATVAGGATRMDDRCRQVRPSAGLHRCACQRLWARRPTVVGALVPPRGIVAVLLYENNFEANGSPVQFQKT